MGTMDSRLEELPRILQNMESQLLESFLGDGQAEVTTIAPLFWALLEPPPSQDVRTSAHCGVSSGLTTVHSPLPTG
jgi:hypothetical protein